MSGTGQNETALLIDSLFSLRGKSALVTGGSSGIGLMMAEGLLRNGARVFIASRDAQRCADAAASLASLGDCIGIAADINDAQQRAGLVERIALESPQGLAILVNNAGSNWGAPLADYPDAAFDKLMKTNVSSVFGLTRDLYQALRRAQRLRESLILALWTACRCRWCSASLPLPTPLVRQPCIILPGLWRWN